MMRACLQSDFENIHESRQNVELFFVSKHCTLIHKKKDIIQISSSVSTSKDESKSWVQLVVPQNIDHVNIQSNPRFRDRRKRLEGKRKHRASNLNSRTPNSYNLKQWVR